MKCPYRTPHDRGTARCHLTVHGQIVSDGVCGVCRDEGHHEAAPWWRRVVARLLRTAGVDRSVGCSCGHRPRRPRMETPIECRYLREERNGTRCRLGRYGGHPTRRECGFCVARGENQIAGAGDALAAAIDALGGRKKPGCGCSARQEALNRMMPRRPVRSPQQGGAEASTPDS